MNADLNPDLKSDLNPRYWISTIARLPGAI